MLLLHALITMLMMMGLLSVYSLSIYTIGICLFFVFVTYTTTYDRGYEIKYRKMLFSVRDAHCFTFILIAIEVFFSL